MTILPQHSPTIGNAVHHLAPYIRDKDADFSGIYVLRIVGMKNVFKIGKSRQVISRFRSIEASWQRSGFGIEFYGVCLTPHHAHVGSEISIYERMLHQMFNHQSAQNATQDYDLDGATECFYLTSNDLELIRLQFHYFMSGIYFWSGYAKAEMVSRNSGEPISSSIVRNRSDFIRARYLSEVAAHLEVKDVEELMPEKSAKTNEQKVFEDALRDEALPVLEIAKYLLDTLDRVNATDLVRTKVCSSGTAARNTLITLEKLGYVAATCPSKKNRKILRYANGDLRNPDTD